MSDVEVVSDSDSELDPSARVRIREIDNELSQIANQIRELNQAKKRLVHDRKTILAEHHQSRLDATKATIDYFSKFPWSTELLREARKVFGIADFRHGQEAVCNAAMDQRDVVVVMPTGAGKSLCYQLPAMLSDTLTVVISPLIALMHDQVYHLRAKNISASLLSSTTSKLDGNALLRSIRSGEGAPKLLYVTPERIAKSKTLLAALQNAYEDGRVGRLVVDEAHCCSTLGHDYRPDYNKLSLLRRLFPSTPIMALTATIGRQALQDMLRILGLPRTTPPDAAISRRTVYLRAPLHRPNLEYSVISRPSNTLESHQMICDYIQRYHMGESGIVYCFSKKDTHAVAEALRQLSHGNVRTGVYHADIDDAAKQQVHEDWRIGNIQVVCATIAFGMGIDKGDVRFVLHASISKSLDGYYQETGRAGSLTAGEVEGQQKLHAMLNYAQSAVCRRKLFASYFEDLAEEVCGQCDNCINKLKRQPMDVSYDGWKVLKVAAQVQRDQGRCTLSALADLCRGLSGARYKIPDSEGRASNATQQLDLEQIGGKSQMSRDNAERLVVQMLLCGYLTESFHATAYTVNVYIIPGRHASQLTQYGLEDAKQLRDKVYLLLEDSAPNRRAKSSISKTSDTQDTAYNPDTKFRKRRKLATDPIPSPKLAQIETAIEID